MVPTHRGGREGGREWERDGSNGGDIMGLE